MRELTYCYRGCTGPSNIRRRMLGRHDYFECYCVKCTSGYQDKEMREITCPRCGAKKDSDELAKPCNNCSFQYSEEIIKSVRAFEKSIIEDSSPNLDGLQLVEYLEDQMKLFTSAGFYDNHYLMLEIISWHFMAAMRVEDWEKAYETGLRYLNGARIYHGVNDVVLGMFLLNLAKCACKLKKKEAAIQYASEAKSIYEITHGGDSDFFLENVLPRFKMCMNTPPN